MGLPVLLCLLGVHCFCLLLAAGMLRTVGQAHVLGEVIMDLLKVIDQPALADALTVG